MFEKRRREIAARRAEIRALLSETGPVDMDTLEQELDALDAEERDLNRREAATRRLNGANVPDDIPAGEPISGPVNPIVGRSGIHGETAGGGLPTGADSRAAHLAALQGIRVEDAAQRASQFATEHRMTITSDAICRSLTLTSGNIAQPTRVSGEDSVAYEVSGGQTAAIKKDDGTAATASAPTLAIAKITPVLLTTLSYVSRNIQRTTPLNYQDRVAAGALTALRKKTGAMIVTGNPSAATPEITGILKAAAISSGSDLELSTIDAMTLRKIALNYGGANNVEGGGVLLLNKADLIVFGDIRGTNEKKAVYEIEFAANSTTAGTIKDGGLSVRFCIVDELPALSDAKTAAASYCMAYGKPLAYQLDLFGPYTVEVSRDYKFAEGLLAVMGEAMIGGNVVSENGFIRVKKSSTSGT